MSSSGSSYTLAKDGDNIEQACSRTFLHSEFPSYEEFWLRFVIPVTNRPANINTKSDTELAAIGKDAHDICHSQLHYTVLRHLAHCYALRNVAAVDPEIFIDFMVRLSSALDPADELLQRFAKPKAYNPWSEDDGRAARQEWRKSCVHRVRAVRDYRNKLLHGRVNPTIVLVHPPSGQQLFLGVRLDRQDAYIDWRLVTASTSPTNPDFVPLTTIMQEAWDLVLGYVEEQWQAALL